MIVKSKYSDCKHLEKDIFDKIGFSPSSILYLTKGVKYDVHAISLFEGYFFVQVINDIKTPCWFPLDFFDLCDNKVPNDWICNFFAEEPKMVLGPEFVAKSIEAYNAMAQLEPNEERLFWDRIKKEGGNTF